MGVLYNIHTEFGIIMKLARIAKHEIHIDKYLSIAFYIQNYLRQGDPILPLHLNLTFSNKEKPKLNVTHWFLNCAYDINFFAENVKTK